MDTNQQENDQPTETYGQMLGEIVWLMTQSPLHKEFFIFELESMVMRPMALQQFRIYRTEKQPAAVVFWAKVSDEVEQRLKEGNARLKAADWQSGDKYWIVDVVAPFGKAEEVIADVHKKVIPDGSLFYLKTNLQGEKEVIEVKDND